MTGKKFWWSANLKRWEPLTYCNYFFVVLYKLPMVQQIPAVEVQCQSLVAE